MLFSFVRKLDFFVCPSAQPDKINIERLSPASEFYNVFITLVLSYKLQNRSKYVKNVTRINVKNGLTCLV